MKTEFNCGPENAFFGSATSRKNGKACPGNERFKNGPENGLPASRPGWKMGRPDFGII
jgi:hypothetical protein